MTKTRLLLLCGMTAASLALAGPEILEGYGEAKWGISEEELVGVVPQAEAHNQTEEQSLFKAPGDAPVVGVIYHFYYGRLVSVAVICELPQRPAEGRDTAGAGLLRALIEEKYYSDDEAGQALQKAGIEITVVAGTEGRVNVVYENKSVRLAADQAREAEHQRRLDSAREAARQKRLPAILKSGITDRL